MHIKLLLGLAIASVTAAKDSVSSMFVYGARQQSLEASIIGNDATVTSYNINCRPGTDTSDCDMGAGLTLLAGPAMTTYFMDNPSKDTELTVICSVAEKESSAVCWQTARGTGTQSPGIHTTTVRTSFSQVPVTITAGEVTSTTSTTTSTSSASTTESDLTSSSSGGVARITGDAGMVVGAIVGFAALL
ncbi:hypothetical protein EYZ11_003949 [Aspergillus tanneri]|uniref:GPI anchored cell wall protein n=1 Tax=Aspergillus tanneri TaxID=1220188 RepID=A0A4S3JP44_9EURO|nr:uncharacterized protein ATNIH1004_010957 [Aspergillus tanneri]KAA8642017.1 hypothetical protein ATNIH1004_010957 [Aspergillus tanneri]THC96557.1 hypothetical protein EYZ11_003949 [Aspergillus tanneri]